MLIVAVTGLGTSGDIMATLEAGFDGHVVKPISLEVIARLLDRVRARRSDQHPRGA
jgi:DNA-binding response OmpR family regulator